MKISVSTYSFGKYVEQLGYREIIGKIKESEIEAVLKDEIMRIINE